MSDRCHEHLRRACEKCDVTVAAGYSDLTTQLADIVFAHTPGCTQGNQHDTATVLAAVVAERLREAREAAWRIGFDHANNLHPSWWQQARSENPYAKGAEK